MASFASRFSQFLTSNLVVLTSILCIFSAFQYQKLRPKRATGRRVRRNTVLDETAAKWCLAAMNTVVRKTRLWWRTS
jgi:hypothetical protein